MSFVFCWINNSLKMVNLDFIETHYILYYPFYNHMIYVLCSLMCNYYGLNHVMIISKQSTFNICWDYFLNMKCSLQLGLYLTKKLTFIQYLLLKYEEASSLHQIVLLSSQIYVAWMVMRLQSSARSIRTLVHHHCCQLNIHLKLRSNTVKT